MVGLLALLVLAAITGYAALLTTTTSGIDVISLTVDPSDFIPAVCRANGITSITGYTPSNGNDLLIGDDNPNVIDGLNGDDCIIGNGGGDTIYGGNGDDVIVGGNGDDIIYGGNGDDVIYGGAGDDQLYGENQGDTLYGGPGADSLDGGRHNDVCYTDIDDTSVTDCETIIN